MATPSSNSVLTYMAMRSLECSLIAALLLHFVVLTAALAQPGDYVQRITAVVEQLQRRIADVNVEIDKQPNDLQLYQNVVRFTPSCTTPSTTKAD